MYFRDRAEGGRLLSKLLKKYKEHADVVVFALPRGGVVTGLEVAKFLKAPLDLIITRKIGHPYQPEYAIAAIAEDGHMIGKKNELDSVDQSWLKKEIEIQREEAKRRREAYLSGLSIIPVEGKTAILVDDGVATGLTIRVAIKELRHRNPSKIVVAVPVVPEHTAKTIAEEADELIALDIPRGKDFLGAIGSYYDDFSPVEDNEVISIMRSYRNTSAPEQFKTKPVHSDPIILAFPHYQYIADVFKPVPDFEIDNFEVKHFSNNELYIHIPSFRPEEDYAVIGTIAPPETNLVRFLFLVHTLKKERAHRITAVLPYLSYSRQDKNEPQKSFATPLIGRLLKSAGVDKVLTIDAHSPEVKTLYPIQLTSLSPAEIFANEIIRLGMDDATILAPDEGALPRAKGVAACIGPDAQVSYLKKERTEKGIIHSEIQGTTGKRIIIIDDILDTGSTLLSCCKKLCAHGAEEIVIMVTHGLFTGKKWEELWKMNVKFIYCTDTIPAEFQPASKKIRMLSVLSLLRNEVQKEQKTVLQVEIEEPETNDYDLNPR